ncbi:MAG: EamA/RhaT family transporter, partial [Rhodobacterales bacterium]|nr:EamA/RhaT family transporter [Rhodobacterales bacterium]
MPIWILATLCAALVQTLRLMLQKRLTGLGLTAGGATLARFLWAAPLAWAAALMLAPAGGMPDLTARFWAFALAGGVAQILGTLATVALFSERSFAVGIGFTKSEPVLVAVFSALILAEPVGLAALAAIGVGTAGLVVLARPA